MAKAPTDEQVQLRRRARRRLIGAMALVTLIAVVLPWVLEHEPKQTDQEVSIQIPSQDSSASSPKGTMGGGPAREKVVSEAEKAAVADATPSSAPAAGDMKAEQDKVLAAPAKLPHAKAAPKDKEKPAAEPKKKAAEKSEQGADGKQYVVQVVALADADKAAEIQRQLAAKGVKAYTEKVKTASGDVTRVRVGPLPSREAAEKERGRMKTLGFDGNVTPR